MYRMASFYSVYVSELIQPKMKKSQHLAVINKHINCTEII